GRPPTGSFFRGCPKVDRYQRAHVGSIGFAIGCEFDSTMPVPHCQRRRREIKPRSFDMKRLLLVICVLSVGSLARAQTPSLGAAATFAVLGGTNVTCTAPGVITGDVGVPPGSAVPFTNGCTIAGGTPPATNVAA